VALVVAPLLFAFSLLACGQPSAPAPTAAPKPAAAPTTAPAAPAAAAPTTAPVAPAAAAPTKAPAAAPAQLTDLRVSAQPEFETFISWEAMQEGLDKQAGLKMSLVEFDSGMPQVQAMAANQWDVGATGCVPMLVGAMQYNALMIGIADDESYANVVMARPDNPVFKTKGSNPKYPEAYGTAADVKGKTVLVTTVSSGHYALSAWLAALGLKDSDVKIQNMEQAQAVAAFQAGNGDFVALWAPFMYTGLQKGWKVVADGSQVGANIPLVMLTSRSFGDAHPDLVAKWMTIYFQGIDKMKAQGTALAPQYQKFMKDWAGMEMTPGDAALDIQKHPVLDLKSQLALFDSSKGQSQAEGWMANIANFFTAQGRFTADQRDQAMKSGFVTDKFLKMVKY
jgi:NitT/TauT family transport system substrate-binding protein/sulfonate transport system substrate-binding protein